MDLTTDFVDCSSNNNNQDGTLPDVAAYAEAGHTQLVIKATEGTGYTFFDGATLHAQAHDHGLTVGRYHWLRPDAGTPVAQAQAFVTVIADSMGPDDWIMTDWETSFVSGPNNTRVAVPEPPDEQWAQFFLDFTAEVQRLMPDVWFPTYTGNWYLDGRPHVQAAARTRPIIIADYAHDPPPNPYDLTYVAHQFTSSENVAGFERPVDYNHWLAADTRFDPKISEDDMQDADWEKLQGLLDAHFERTSTMVANGLIALRTGKTSGQFTDERKRLVDGQGIDGRVHSVRADLDQITTQLAQINNKLH